MLQHCHSKILAITYTYTHTKQHHDTIKKNEKELCKLFCLLLESLIHIRHYQIPKSEILQNPKLSECQHDTPKDLTLEHFRFYFWMRDAPLVKSMKML